MSSSSDRYEINEVLSSLGLHSNEQTIYLALLAQGPSTLTPISNEVNLPITTVQSIINRLNIQGLVITTKNKSRNIYEAASPKILKKKLEEQIKEIDAIVPLLESLSKQNNQSAKVTVFHRERISDVLNKIISSKEKNICEIVAAADFQKMLGEKFHFTKRRVAKNIHLKSLRVESQEIKKYTPVIDARELREAKYLPKEFNFKSSILFWGDSVALFSNKGEGLALVIQSRSLREMFEQFFNLFWSLSRKM